MAAVSGEIAFGCAISDTCACHPKKARKHGSIVAAGRSGSGKILVDLAPFYGHPWLLVPRMEMLYAKHDPVAVVVNPKSHSGTLVKPLSDVGIVVLQVTAQDVAVAHGQFLDLVEDGDLEHLDQEPLTAAVRAAQQRPLAGAQAWDPKVPVDQGPLVAATLACWAFARWEELAAPGAWAILGGTVRLSAVLLAVSLAGVLGGGWLAGAWTGLGAAIIFDSLCLGAWALLRDDGKSEQQPQAHEVPTLAGILEKARRAG